MNEIIGNPALAALHELINNVNMSALIVFNRLFGTQFVICNIT